jgi:ANTAR domain-containing protein/GAF domain-containing protein
VISLRHRSGNIIELRLSPDDQCTGVKQRRGPVGLSGSRGSTTPTSSGRSPAAGRHRCKDLTFMAHPPMDLLRAIAELGRIRFSEMNFDDVCKRISDLARETVSGADEVSITHLMERGPHTPAATGEVARQLDEVQYTHLSGPCLDASAHHTVVSVVDIAADGRWPEWAAEASAAGIRSSLSVGLPSRGAVQGALNLYARAAGAFDDDMVGAAWAFAADAAVALANAHLYGTTVALAAQLRLAMEHRAVIEQAKGIVMSERRCTAEEAFAILATISQASNRKLRDIASTIVNRTVSGSGRPGGSRPTASRRNSRQE